jgi:hypothetical protein
MLVDRRFQDAGQEVLLLSGQEYDLAPMVAGALIATSAAVAVQTISPAAQSPAAEVEP